MIHAAGSVVLVICAVLSMTFVVVYHYSAVWWRSEVGKHLMAIASSETAILTTQSIRLIIGEDTSWFSFIRLVVFLSFPVTLIWRLWILWKLQIRPRRGRREGS